MRRPFLPLNRFLYLFYVGLTYRLFTLLDLNTFGPLLHKIFRRHNETRPLQTLRFPPLVHKNNKWSSVPLVNQRPKNTNDQDNLNPGTENTATTALTTGESRKQRTKYQSCRCVRSHDCY